MGKGKQPPFVTKPKDPARGTHPPPKIPMNIRRRPIGKPMKPVHAEAKRLARKRKRLYD